MVADAATASTALALMRRPLAKTPKNRETRPREHRRRARSGGRRVATWATPSPVDAPFVELLERHRHRRVRDVEWRTARGERHDVIDRQVGGSVRRALVARAPVAVPTAPGTQDAGAEPLPGAGAVQGVVPTAVGLAGVLRAALPARLVTTPQTVHTSIPESSAGWVARTIRSGCYACGAMRRRRGRLAAVGPSAPLHGRPVAGIAPYHPGRVRSVVVSAADVGVELAHDAQGVVAVRIPGLCASRLWLWVTWGYAESRVGSARVSESDRGDPRGGRETPRGSPRERSRLPCLLPREGAGGVSHRQQRRLRSVGSGRDSELIVRSIGVVHE